MTNTITYTINNATEHHTEIRISEDQKTKILRDAKTFTTLLCDAVTEDIRTVK